MRTRYPSSLAVAVLLLALGLVGVAEGQTEEGEFPDSLAADSLAADSSLATADSTGLELGEIGGEEGTRPEGFHPRFRLSFREDRDSQSWQQNLQQLTFSLGDRLSVTTGITANSKKGKNVEQENSARRSSSQIVYTLTENVDVNASLGLTYNENRSSRGSRKISSDNFDVGTSYQRAWGELLDAKFDLNAGTAGNRNVYFESRGMQGEITSHFISKPWSWANATIDHRASIARQNSVSRPQESETQGSETQDRERENTLTGNLAFTLPKESSLNFSWTLDNGRFQRPDTLETGGADEGGGAAQETKTLENRSMSVQADMRAVPGLQLTLDGNWSRRVTDYALQRNAYILSRDQGGKFGARYQLPAWSGFGAPNRQTEIGLSFSTRRSRSEYRPDEGQQDRTGTTTFHSLHSSITQPLGRRASLDVSGKIDLQVHEFDFPKSYDQDRDVLDQKVNVRATYDPFDVLKLTSDFVFIDRRTVYILASRSAQNNHAQTFSLKPSLTFRFSRRVTVSQNYGVDITYTEYTFNEERNSVARIYSLNTSFNYTLSQHVGFSISHDYRDTDQGSYEHTSDGRRLFNPHSENEKQEMSVSVNYTPHVLFALSVDQRLQIERRWNFANGIRLPGIDTFNQYFTGQLHGRLAGRQHLSFSYQIALNLGEGDRVPETQRRFWTANVEVGYTY